VLPLAVPGLISAGIFAFTLSWNEFIYALTFIQSSENKTVPVGVVTELVEGDVYHWGSLMAGALLGSLPVAIFYSFFVEYYVSGDDRRGQGIARRQPLRRQRHRRQLAARGQHLVDVVGRAVDQHQAGPFGLASGCARSPRPAPRGAAAATGRPVGPRGADLEAGAQQAPSALLICTTMRLWQARSSPWWKRQVVRT
jgi:hypothetical protein